MSDSTPAKININAARASVFLSVVVLVIKFGAYQLTKSTAVFSDAIESIVNVIAAIVALSVLRAVASPADKEHPYGHGKLEYFSSASEGGLITFAALAIAVESVKAFIEGRVLNQPDVGLIVMLIAGFINLLLAFHLKSVGKKYHSEALKASGAHVLSDVWTTVAVMAGLGLVFLTGLQWIDAIVGFLVALQLGYSGFQIVKRSLQGLMDQQDPDILKEIVAAFNQHKEPWVIDVHQLKMIRSGRFHHIDAHLVVPEYMNVAQVHEDCHHFEEKVVASYPFDGEIAFHLDPCGQKYCRKCEMKECLIRLDEFKGKNVFTSDSCVGAPNK